MVDVSVLVAGGVLLVGVVILLALRGRRRDIVATAESAATTGSTPVIRTGEPDSAATLAATEAVGDAMIDAGFSGVTVRRALEDIAEVNGLPSSQILVFPTALLVSARGRASTAPARSRAASGACCSPRSTSCNAPSTRPGRACSTPSRRSAASARSAR